MKTLAKLNTKGFTVQDIIESGFSFEEYDSLVVGDSIFKEKGSLVIHKKVD